MKTIDIKVAVIRAPTLPPFYAVSGRRTHQRFSVLALPEGILHVKGDVVVQSATSDQLVVVSRQPGVPGETVSVQSPDVEASVTARVVGSQPIVMDGSVRHQLLLRQVGGEDDR